MFAPGPPNNCLPVWPNWFYPIDVQSADSRGDVEILEWKIFQLEANESLRTAPRMDNERLCDRVWFMVPSTPDRIVRVEEFPV